MVRTVTPFTATGAVTPFTATGAALLLIACGVALSGCPPAGVSCGRGRCHQGACINAISTHTPKGKPNLDWWCVVPCDGTATCASDMCLVSPTHTEISVCAGNQLEVKYEYTGGEIPTDTGSKVLTSITIERPGKPTMTCGVNEVCNAGWFSSGEMLPTVRGTTSSGTTIYVANGTPGEGLDPAESAVDGEWRGPLGQYLPTGLNIVVHPDGPVDDIITE